MFTCFRPKEKHVENTPGGSARRMGDGGGTQSQQTDTAQRTDGPAPPLPPVSAQAVSSFAIRLKTRVQDEAGPASRPTSEAGAVHQLQTAPTTTLSNTLSTNEDVLAQVLGSEVLGTTGFDRKQALLFLRSQASSTFDMLSSPASSQLMPEDLSLLAPSRRHVQILGGAQELVSDLQSLKFMARGASSLVFKGLWQSAEVAVKVLVGDLTSRSPSVREVLLGTELSHPNLNHVYSVRCAQLSSEFLRAAEDYETFASLQAPNSPEYLAVRRESSFDSNDGFGPPPMTYVDTDSRPNSTTSPRGLVSFSSLPVLEEPASAAAAPSAAATGRQPTRLRISSGTFVTHRGASTAGPGSTHATSFRRAITAASELTIEEMVLAADCTGTDNEEEDGGDEEEEDGDEGEISLASHAAAEARGGEAWAAAHRGPWVKCCWAEVLRALKAKPGQYLSVIIAEWAGLGSLSHSIHHHQLFRTNPDAPPDPSRLALRALLRTAREVALGLRHLHEAGVIHADLKPGNVVLMEARLDRRGFVAKLTDLGLSRVLAEGKAAPSSSKEPPPSGPPEASSSCATAPGSFLAAAFGSTGGGAGSAAAALAAANGSSGSRQMGGAGGGGGHSRPSSSRGAVRRTSVGSVGRNSAGQVTELYVRDADWGTTPYMAPEHLQGVLLKSSDIYSFGVLVWEMAHAKRPFANIKHSDIASGVVRGTLQLEWDAVAPAALRALVARCLARVPLLRPSAAEVIGELESIEAAVRSDIRRERSIVRTHSSGSSSVSTNAGALRVSVGSNGRARAQVVAAAAAAAAAAASAARSQAGPGPAPYNTLAAAAAAVTALAAGATPGAAAAAAAPAAGPVAEAWQQAGSSAAGISAATAAPTAALDIGSRRPRPGSHGLVPGPGQGLGPGAPVSRTISAATLSPAVMGGPQKGYQPQPPATPRVPRASTVSELSHGRALH